MKSLGLTFFTDIHWTLIALMIFFVFFVGLIIRTYWSSDSAALEQMKFQLLDIKEAQDELKR